MVDRLNSKYVDGLSNKVQANVKYYTQIKDEPV